jgi:phosphoribosylglycinamide formyltransferase 1
MTLRLGVLASHAGSTFEHIVSACEAGIVDATVQVLVSNNSQSGALAIAQEHGVPAVHISSRTHPTWDDEQRAIASVLLRSGVEWVALAGYMKLVGPPILQAYNNRVLNVHPALLPAFGGVGMYGDHVHAAVLEAGVPMTGASIHIVAPEYDTGPVLAQEKVPVNPGDDVNSLGQRVREVERRLYIETLERIAKGALWADGPTPGVAFTEDLSKTSHVF